MLLTLTFCASAEPARAADELPAPIWSYRADPHSRGILVDVSSAAPEVAIVQCRARCWVLEGNRIDYLFAGDRLEILELARGAGGVTWQRITPIAEPRFALLLPIAAN